MTVEALEVVSAAFAPNGVTTVFPFEFEVSESDEVAAYLDGVLLDPALYSVTLNDDGTGSAAFFVAPVGSELLLTTDPDFGQPTIFENQGPYFQRAIQTTADREAIKSLWLRARVIALMSTSLLISHREGMFLSWDAANNPVLATGTGADGALRADLAAATGAGLVGTTDGALQDVLDGVPKLKTSGPWDGFVYSENPLWIGNGTANGSTDPGLVISRELGPGDVPLGSPHMFSANFKSSFGGGLSQNTFDDRSGIEAGAMNHHAVNQLGLTVSGTGDVVQVFMSTCQVTLDGPDANVDNIYGSFMHDVVEVNGAAFGGRIVGLVMNGIPRDYGDISDPNYVFLSNGLAPAVMAGQMTAGNVVATSSETTAGAKFHAVTAAEVCGMRLQVLGQNWWEWRLPAADTYLSLFNSVGGGAGTEYLRVEVDGDVLPGTNGTQDLGAAGSQFDNIFLVNAPTVSSDERRKKVRGKLTTAERKWASLIEPVLYQLNEAIAKKGGKARLHMGALAQQVHAAGKKAKIAEPFDYEFLCRDPKFDTVVKTRTGQRQKTERAEVERTFVEIENGKPVQKKRIEVVEDRPVFERMQVHDENEKPVMTEGRPVLEPVLDDGGKPFINDFGQPVMRQVIVDGKPQHDMIPLFHEVPVMEDFEEEYVELERALDENGEPDYDWSLRYEPLSMFLYAALRERVTALEKAKA